jgi:hypothetical protein
MNVSHLIVATVILFTTASLHSAITVNSSTFNGVTDGAVSTAGLADWGYFSNDGNTFDGVYDNVAFGSLGITTVSGSSSIGTVTLTENDGVNDAIQAQTNDANFTFDSNSTFGSYGGYAPGEQNVWTINFNDLGVGQFLITLYLGHSSTNRGFDMDVSGSGITPFTTTTGGSIAGLGSTVAAYGTSGVSFTYDIDITTTAANDSLTLVHGDTGGGSFGGAIFAGYTVAAIPEPSSLSLIVLGGLSLALLRRQRR